MSNLTIFFISIGLAMDAFAVSISRGLVLKNTNFSSAIYSALKFGIFFSIFQMVMPSIGFYSARVFRDSIIAFDHWIAFILLFVIGSKMIYETFKEEEHINKGNTLSFKNLIILSIATSVDALAVGVSFAFVYNNILLAIIIIGSITFILSFFGVILGKRLGEFFKKGAERFGGAILIFIGFKILFQHLFLK